MKNISQAAFTIIKKMQQNELTESAIYEAIAKFAKGQENKEVLLRLSQEEKAHYEIWKNYTGLEMKPQKRKVFRYKLLARIFGFTFAVKLMENGEEAAQEETPSESETPSEEEVNSDGTETPAETPTVDHPVEEQPVEEQPEEAPAEEEIV